MPGQEFIAVDVGQWYRAHYTSGGGGGGCTFVYI